MVDLTQFEGHTPGSWCIETPMGDDQPWIVQSGLKTYEWDCIALCYWETDSKVTRKTFNANLELIAAAPTLLQERNQATAEVKRLREALQPFADAALGFDPEIHTDATSLKDTGLCVAHLRKARTVLATGETP